MYTKTFWKFWNLTSHGSLWGGQNWKITVSKMLPTPFFFLESYIWVQLKSEDFIKGGPRGNSYLFRNGSCYKTCIFVFLHVNLLTFVTVLLAEAMCHWFADHNPNQTLWLVWDTFIKGQWQIVFSLWRHYVILI